MFLIADSCLELIAAIYIVCLRLRIPDAQLPGSGQKRSCRVFTSCFCSTFHCGSGTGAQFILMKQHQAPRAAQWTVFIFIVFYFYLIYFFFFSHHLNLFVCGNNVSGTPSRVNLKGTFYTSLW